MDVTIAVATCGDLSWARLAERRAIPSAVAQGVPVVSRHVPGSVADARNAALEQVTTEWVIHLDADDELEAGYVQAVAAATGDLRAPSVRYVRPGWTPPRPRMLRVAGHRRACTGDCLPEGNWLVVGTAVRTDLVRTVGGWHNWDVYEDWDLWLRCWRAGATVEPVPRAVYRAHVRPDSRNRAADHETRLRTHHAIAAANQIGPAA